MNSSYLFLYLILFSQFFNIKQEKLKIEDIKIYNYKEKKGFTAGAACSQFMILKTKNHKLDVSKEDIVSIQKIIDNSKVKKSLPPKMGTNILFVQIMDKNNNLSDVTFGSNYIADCTNNITYWIENKNDQEWIISFINNSKK